MQNINEKIIQEYSGRLAQSEYDNIYLQVQVGELQAKLKEYEDKENVDEKEESKKQIIQEVENE